MPSRSSDWEALNAYVDGELDPARTAEVAEQIAHDPGRARQAAALTGMKATLADTQDVPAFDFDPPATEGQRQWRWLAVAASAVLFLAASAFWVTQFNQEATPGPG